MPEQEEVSLFPDSNTTNPTGYSLKIGSMIRWASKEEVALWAIIGRLRNAEANNQALADLRAIEGGLDWKTQVDRAKNELTQSIICGETQLHRAAELAFKAFDERYDGATDSKDQWMVEPMKALEEALRLPILRVDYPARLQRVSEKCQELLNDGALPITLDEIRDIYHIAGGKP